MRDPMEGSGIVTSIRISHNPSDNIYNIIGQKALQTKSGIQLGLYDSVDMRDGKPASVRKLSDKAMYGQMLSESMQAVDIEANSSRIIAGGKKYWSVSGTIIERLKDAAHLLVKGFVAGAPIVVRFHNDGDGATGAIALHRALSELQERLFDGERSVSWSMNRSIAYTLESFYSDRMVFESYESAERPIVVITDFGTSPESLDAIRASQGVCDIIWLDHHMPYDGFPREMVTHYINSCDLGADSNFTAGLLSCIFAQVLAGVDVEDLKDAALVSDYSAYADFGNKDALRISIILDYITSRGSEADSKPRRMDAIIKDSGESERVFRHASELMDEAISYGIKNASTYINSDAVRICVLDFTPIARSRADYPLPGRYSSKLQSRLESINNGRTVTIVHYGNYVSIRVSSDIGEKVDILGIIERLKDMSHGLATGGGHRQAASIRTDREHIDETIRMLLAELGIGATGGSA
ncbi:MAG: hypothetical protein KGI06_02950 [Candidatus Micrarchaeota archaeon]|nr:hypothetical protein [Candidatus Micrarchaeota archaeon]